MSNYYLPDDTAKLVDASLPRCQNLGLILDKYVPKTVIGTDKETKQKGEKAKWLNQRVQNDYVDKVLAQHAYQRWLDAVTAMNAIPFNARTDWRMVVGLGGETVLETDLTLHHVYGIPFIPGSALKGLTRAYVTGEIEGHKSNDIDKDDALVQRIFGTQKDAGSVIFFDAMPLDGQCSIELDIMNSHYPDYYSQQQPPTNDQNPNPVTFLTVKDTTFTFAIALRPSLSKEHTVDKATGKSHLELAQKWLQDALRDYGVGGKTSAGYGSLTVVRQTATASTQPVQQQQVEIEPLPTTPITPADPEISQVKGYIKELDFIGRNAVSGRLPGYYPKWQKLTSTDAKIMFAKALVAKAREGMRERDLARSPWYKELSEFLDKA